MNWLEKITPENFDKSFDIKQVLTQSAFYPASGTDGSHIPIFTKMGILSFVNVDYSIPKEKVEEAMKQDFIGVGYTLIGLKHIHKEEITPDGFSPKASIPFNAHEKHRMASLTFVKERMLANNFTPFAIWGVYELNHEKTKQTHNKAKRFSLLHIGGEACATYDATYLNNCIKPEGIAIIRPSEGYGDNWTLFTNPEFRLHKMLMMNCSKTENNMPRYLLTGNTMTQGSFWPNYNYLSQEYSDDLSMLYLFQYGND